MAKKKPKATKKPTSAKVKHSRAAKPARTTRKPNRKPAKNAPKPRRAAARPATPEQISTALAAYRRAQDELGARASDVLAVVNQLSASAVADFRSRLQGSLLQDRILDDLAVLAERAASHEQAAEMRIDLRLLASAVLQWADQHLEIRPHLRPGEEIEMPAGELDEFEFAGEPPSDSNSLIRIRVVRPGWRVGREVLSRPQVELCRADVIAR